MAIFLRLGGDPSRNSRSVKTSNTLSLLVFFWGLGPPPEGPGDCLERFLGGMLEDVGSKMVFFGISWARRCQGRGKLGATVRPLWPETAKAGRRLPGSALTVEGGRRGGWWLAGALGEGFREGKEISRERDLTGKRFQTRLLERVLERINGETFCPRRVAL